MTRFSLLFSCLYKMSHPSSSEALFGCCPGGSRDLGAPQPLDHEGEQSRDNAARALSQVISAGKQGPPPSFAGWCNNLTRSCFASQIRARQTMCRRSLSGDKSRQTCSSGSRESTSLSDQVSSQGISR